MMNANIVEVVHDRLSSATSAGSARVTLSLEMQGKDQMDQITESFRRRNIQFTLVT